MSMAITAKRWTVDEVRALPHDGNRYEVVAGELWMTPAPSWDHQRLVGELHALLRSYLKTEPVGEALLSPADVVFDIDTAVEPDIFVIPRREGPRPRSFAEAGGILLTVEVLSPSTARRDRGPKRELYQERRVVEYWIVDPVSRLLERWTPTDTRPEVVHGTLVWQPQGSRAAFELDLPRFFAEMLDT